ncbi:MAG: hypothetical protein F6J94_26685 [Moorea sp. SIO1F2]|nr:MULTISPECIES: hypothetical protein [unclassified Moorena]NEO22967.1 hypothetical protein [Moorena sp. SIO4A5]NEQ57771.1 hypothetical protein [Moorena sp. SIO4A1]NET85358.1 hypothetical protein [Moorena sp. SIO1F2]
MRYAHAMRTAISYQLKRYAHATRTANKSKPVPPIPDSRFPIPDSRFPCFQLTADR